MKMKWNIGDSVKDEGGNLGVVAIVWNDGDICTIENDAAHPNPKWTSKGQLNRMVDELIKADERKEGAG